MTDPQNHTDLVARLETEQKGFLQRVEQQKHRQSVLRDLLVDFQSQLDATRASTLRGADETPSNQIRTNMNQFSAEIAEIEATLRAAPDIANRLDAELAAARVAAAAILRKKSEDIFSNLVRQSTKSAEIREILIDAVLSIQVSGERGTINWDLILNKLFAFPSDEIIAARSPAFRKKYALPAAVK